MKNTFILILATILLIGCQSKQQELRIMQFNIWHEGSQVENGFTGIVQQIIASKADIITFSEIDNIDNSRFCDRIVEALKNKGQTWYSFYSSDTGILSKYPIKSNREIFHAKNNINKAIIEIKNTEFAIYSAHLDYLHCSYYLAKGYDGCEWFKLEAPVLDVDSILRDNLASKRDEAIQAFLLEAEADKKANRTVILAGDFNEASYLDWVEATKDMFGRNGLVIPWNQTLALANAGFVDCYREAYPNPVTHTGFTYPAYTEGVDFAKLIWAPEMDERERIDYIFYQPQENITLKNIIIWGPDESVSVSKRIKERSADIFQKGEGIWPSDHKAILATFIIRI